jgi:hypothetical protein
VKRLIGLVVSMAMVAIVAGGRPAPASAQAGAPATLRVAVTDSTGAVIVGARVQARQAGVPERQAVTGDLGVAVIEGLQPGAVEVVVESDGFERRVIADRRLRAGTNRLDVRLQIAGIAVSIEVARDAREKQLDTRGDAFSRILTPDMIAQLPDDPDELQNVLQQMAGPGAVFRVNGFGGGKLPNKSQIRQIRFSLNTFSAELHELGVPIVDILTQPGLDRWRSTFTAGFRNDALTARYAYAPTASSGDSVGRGSFVMDGPLWRNHTSMSLTLDGASLSDPQTFLVSGGERAASGLAIRDTTRRNFSLLVEHAVTKAHTARFELTRNGSGVSNLGVGDINLPERAYSTDQTGYMLRLSDTGPIGKKLFNEARLQVNWNAQDTTSANPEQAIIVQGTAAWGGAQQASSRRSWDIEAADNLDFSRGRHALRTGVLVQGGQYRAMDAGNTLGTFTFSPAGYERIQPMLFRQRIGDPLVDYGFYKAGWYLQDDIKAHKTATLALGVRHEVQSEIDDHLNFSPRVGLIWAPMPNGKLTVRAGAGIVYNWYEPSLYEQALRGEQQYDWIVVNPGFPDPLAGAVAVALPPSRIVQSRVLHLPRLFSTSAGLVRQFKLTTTLMATYTYQRGVDLFRGRDLNAPVNGVRPDPTRGQITAIEASGRSRMDRFDLTFSRLGMQAGKAKYLFTISYILARMQNDTDGAFSVPSNAQNPGLDWGPAASDLRHRVASMGSAMLPKGFRVLTMVTATSAPPYNITTGFDDNGDTIFNDRPAGVGRNSARGAAVFDVMARLGWGFGFGKAPGPQTGIPNVKRIASQGDPLGGIASALGGQAHRYRVEFYAQIYNVFNRVNEVGFRGVLNAPLFGSATASLPPRRVEIGTRFDF